MEEEVVVRNVVFPFGECATRLALFRIFSRCGEIVSLNIVDRTARISFAASDAAQAAYIKMNGFMVFGHPLTVMIAAPLSVGLEGCRVSSTPTLLLLIDNADVSWVQVALKRIKGVSSCEPLGHRQTLVKFSSVPSATIVRKSLHGKSHPTLGVMSASYLRHLA
jgi:hypothetical protein